MIDIFIVGSLLLCFVLPLCVLMQVYYLRAINEGERQRWVTVLTLAKAKAIKHMESGIYSGIFTK